MMLVFDYADSGV